MPIVIPSHEPLQFVAGDTVQWTKSLSDFPSSAGWVLRYRFTNAVAGTEIPAAAVVTTPNTAGGWDVVLSPANLAIAAGIWRLVGWVVLSATGERRVVYDEAMTILADATNLSPGALLTDNERTLAAIEARLAGRVTADQEAVTINGTTLTRIPIEKLGALRGVYAARVWHEQNPGRSSPVHKVRFGHVR